MLRLAKLHQGLSTSFHTVHAGRVQTQLNPVARLALA